MIPARIVQSIAELEAQQLDEPVHFTESLVELVLRELTVPGDRVLDPFAGFGTTLVVAERLDRRAVGVELLPERVDLIRSRVSSAEVVLGDARRLAGLVDGGIDLCLTSPPYRARVDHPEDPLDGYRSSGGTYAGYLDELAGIFSTVAGLMVPGGHLAINAANIRTDDGVTSLVTDLCTGLAEAWELISVSELIWDVQPEWMVSDHLIVLRVPA